MRTNLMGYPKAPVKTVQPTASKVTTSTGKIVAKPPTQTNLKENVSGNQKLTHGARFADPDYMEPESKAYGRFTQEPPVNKLSKVVSQPNKVQPKPQSASQRGRNQPQVNSYMMQPEMQYGRNDKNTGSYVMQPQVQASSRNNIAVKQSVTSNQVKKPQRPMSSKAPVQPSSGRGPAFREPMVVPQNLEECRECGRKFNEKALAKHEKICKKVFSQKRKVFNSAKQRIVSKQQIQLNKRGQNKYETSPQKRQAMPKWKQQSLAFRMAMKQAKGHAPSMNQMKMMQQVNESSHNMTLCKWCGRKFQHVTAQRHIPFCQKKAKEAMLRKPGRR